MMLHSLLRRSRALWNNRQWRRLILVGTLAASAAVLLLGLIRGWPEMARYQWQFNWRPLILSGLLYSIPLILAILAWMVIARALEVASSWRQDAQFFLYSWIVRRLPTPAPYVASRVLLYEGIGVPKRIISVGLLWENMLIIASGAIMAVLLLPITPLISDRRIGIAVALTTAVSLFFIARPALLSRVVSWLLRRLGKPPLMVFLRPRMAILALVVYAAAWLMGGVILFLLIRVVYPLEWALFPLVLQSWVISGLAAYVTFFAPVGFGVRDLTLVALLTLAIPLSVAVVIALLVRVWIMVSELFWALIIYKL